MTAEELDSAMDDYWAKSDNKELAAKKLDDDMDAYWEKKKEVDASAASTLASSESDTKNDMMDSNTSVTPTADSSTTDATAQEATAKDGDLLDAKEQATATPLVTE